MICIIQQYIAPKQRLSKANQLKPAFIQLNKARRLLSTLHSYFFFVWMYTYICDFFSGKKIVVCIIIVHTYLQMPTTCRHCRHCTLAILLREVEWHVGEYNVYSKMYVHTQLVVGIRTSGLLLKPILPNSPPRATGARKKKKKRYRAWGYMYYVYKCLSFLFFFGFGFCFPTTKGDGRDF